MRNFRSARRCFLPSCLEPARSAKKRSQDTPLATRPASSFFPLFCWLDSACDENCVAIGALRLRSLLLPPSESTIQRHKRGIAGRNAHLPDRAHQCDRYPLPHTAGRSRFYFPTHPKLHGLGDLIYAAASETKPI